MSQIVPKKYCTPGQNSEESPELCAPVGVTVGLKASPVFIVSLNGDTWLEGDFPDDMADPLESSQSRG